MTDATAAAEDGAPELPDTYRLAYPVKWGEQLIETLTLRANGRAMQGVKILVRDEAIEFEPYRFAELGLKLAGQPRAIVDMMHPRDQTGLGMVALGFIAPGLGTGSRPSP